MLPLLLLQRAERGVHRARSSGDPPPPSPPDLMSLDPSHVAAGARTGAQSQPAPVLLSRVGRASPGYGGPQQLRDGLTAPRTTQVELKSGDELALIPPISGG
eukprot:SAG11_NODE_2978_length_2795_cov_4.170623_2_plen_102_part_00